MNNSFFYHKKVTKICVIHFYILYLLRIYNLSFNCFFIANFE